MLATTTLTTRTLVHAPGRISPTRTPWSGTLGQAFEVDGDRMWQRLVDLCESADVTYVDEEADEPLNEDEILVALAEAGWEPGEILTRLFDDPNIGWRSARTTR